MRGPRESSQMHCGFCGLPGADDRPLLGGLGVMICQVCAHEAARSFDEGTELAATAFEAHAEEELVGMLRGVTRQRPQLERFQRDLVDYMRSRGMSWGSIGDGLGVARQSAWERFRGDEGR
ncbi:MAG: hypothetical protein L0H39_04480 [Brachybacterium sp.]|nr:hypothetical protein [Brachybacterium sp.]